jgi:hypothetical protein
MEATSAAVEAPTTTKSTAMEAAAAAHPASVTTTTTTEPWLFRACIRQGGRPGDCSDDANSHP